jgi:hypothetical protein
MKIIMLVIRLKPFGFPAVKEFNISGLLNTLVLSTRWKLSQKNVVHTKFDIYVFIYLFLACKEFIDRMLDIEYSTLQSKENFFQRLDAKLIVNNTFDVTFTCINDNKLIGMSNVKCFNNGSWSHNTPTCLEQCFDLNALDNIEVSLYIYT